MKTTDPTPSTTSTEPTEHRFGRRGFLIGLAGTIAVAACGKEPITAVPAERPSTKQSDADTETDGNSKGGNTAKPNKTEAEIVEEILESSTETPDPLDGEEFGAQADGAATLWEINTENDGVKKYVEAVVGQLNDWVNSAAEPEGKQDADIDPISKLTGNDERAIENIFGTESARGAYNPNHSSDETEKDIKLFKDLHAYVIGQRRGSLMNGTEQFKLTLTLDSFEEVNVLGVKGGVYQLGFESNNPEQLEELMSLLGTDPETDLRAPRGIGGAVRDRDGDGSGSSPLTAYTTVLCSEAHLRSTKELSPDIVG